MVYNSILTLLISNDFYYDDQFSNKIRSNFFFLLILICQQEH